MVHPGHREPGGRASPARTGRRSSTSSPIRRPGRLSTATGSSSSVFGTSDPEDVRLPLILVLGILGAPPPPSSVPVGLAPGRGLGPSMKISSIFSGQRHVASCSVRGPPSPGSSPRLREFPAGHAPGSRHEIDPYWKGRLSARQPQGPVVVVAHPDQDQKIRRVSHEPGVP